MDKVKYLLDFIFVAFHCGLNYTQRIGENYTGKSMYCDHDETVEHALLNCIAIKKKGKNCNKIQEKWETTKCQDKGIIYKYTRNDINILKDDKLNSFDVLIQANSQSQSSNLVLYFNPFNFVSIVYIQYRL